MKRKCTDVSGEVATKIQRVSYQHAAPQANYYTPGENVGNVVETELRSVIDNFIKVYESLDQANGVESKPNYSYTEMIYIAMLRSANFCLPITEIYRYITTKFPFFCTSGKEHWRNAVRHSLSKTKCFTKIAVGRGVSSAGKLQRSTYLWCIVPSSIINFARGDYRSNVDNESGTNTLRWGYYKMNAGQFWERVSRYVETKMERFRQNLTFSDSPASIFETQICALDSTKTACGKTACERSPHNYLYPKSSSPTNNTTSTFPYTPISTPQPRSYPSPTTTFSTTLSPCSPMSTANYSHPTFIGQTSTPVIQAHSSTNSSLVTSQQMNSPRIDCFMLNRLSPISNNSSYLCVSGDSGNGTLSDTSSVESVTSCRWSNYRVDAMPVVCDGGLYIPASVHCVKNNTNISPSTHSVQQETVSLSVSITDISKSPDLPCLDSFFQSSCHDIKDGYDFSYWFSASTPSSCDSTPPPFNLDYSV